MITDQDIGELYAAFADNEKKEKLARYQVLNQYVKKGQVLFTGSSLMEQFPIYELMLDFNIRETIYNRGIGGYTTIDMLKALDTMVFDLEPGRIFINIGSNDMNLPDFTREALIERYQSILLRIRERLPSARIYVMAYYPVNGEDDFGNEGMKAALKVRTNARIQEVNAAVEEMARRLQVKFINVNQRLYDKNQNLKKEYTIEGMHMYAGGYRAILDELMEYVREE
jgi:lysophospholipase L1-like esterase